jgi:hypothetical protein
MADILKWTGLTKHDISAPSMLREIAKEKPKNVFVIVWPKDGGMPTYHSSTADMPTVLMRVQGFIHKFYNGDFEA